MSTVLHTLALALQDKDRAWWLTPIAREPTVAVHAKKRLKKVEAMQRAA